MLEMVLDREKLVTGKHPDFVFCLGATKKDEEMLGKLAKPSKENTSLEVKFRREEFILSDV